MISVRSACISVSVIENRVGAGYIALNSDIRNNRSIIDAIVGYVNHPFGYGKVFVFHVFGAYAKPALILTLYNVLYSVAIGKSVA